jgi:transposase
VSGNEKSSGFLLLREQVPCPISSRRGRRQPKYNPVIQGHFFAVHKILQVTRKYASGEDDARTVDKGTGIVPRQYSTGGKAKLLGISKRGNVYLRKILIHGAQTAVLRIKRDRAPIGPWLDALDARAPKNVVVVAMANKLARIAWAVLSSGEDYRPMGNRVAA